MTDELKRAVAALENLPEAAQNEAAARIQQIAAELAERRWDELFADPRSAQFFDEIEALYEQAKRENGFLPIPR